MTAPGGLVVPASRRALLVDGSSVLVRPLGPWDRPAIERLHREFPPRDRHQRFGGTAGGRAPDRVAHTAVGPGSIAVGAFRGERLVGVAYARRGFASPDPEIAVVVAHREQARGIASLLLEHLVSAARTAGARRLTAKVLADNHDMLRVVADAGLPVTRRAEGDVLHLVLDLPAVDGPDGAGERYLDAMFDREERAAAASLRPVLAPRSVAVIGAGRRPDSVGRALLGRIVESGFHGPVYVVHPHAATVAGLPTCRSVADLPPDVDLAVLAVPGPAVPGLVRECGEHGIRAVLVVSAGVDGSPGGEQAAAVEKFGLRLVGPNCLGLVDTDPAVSLQASFGPEVAAGSVGLAVQSGGVAIALAAELGRLGLGVSTLVSTGEAADVNGDDLLLWWARDGRTRAAVLYVESLRRPRRFARLARRLSRRIPVLTVRSGSSAAGARAAVSHSAGGLTPRVVRDALFAQAGVTAVDELGELPGLLALLCDQPLPAGRRVAVLGNAGGFGVLAADACARSGLTVGELASATRDALARVLPAGAATANPVDTTATVRPGAFAAALQVLLADDEVDAVVVVGVATALADPLAGIVRGDTKPVVVVSPGQPARVERVPDAAGDPVAVFAEAGAAARAIAAAADRAHWLRRPADPAPVPPGVDREAARAIVTRALAELPAGGWLAPQDGAALLGAAGVAVVETEVVTTVEEAVRRRREHGVPLALKADVADVADVLHRSREGAVRTGVDGPVRIGQVFAEFRERFGDALRGVVVQPMAAPGTELLLGATADPLCGPLLTYGLGGTGTDVLDDRAHCLVPATEQDLDDLVDGLRVAPRLYAGKHGARVRGAARDAAARLAWLAAVLPEVVEAEVNPLVVGAGDPVAVDVRVRVAPPPCADPYLRHLPA